MTYEEFRDFCKEHYKRKPWLPSLALTDANIKRLFEVYRTGIVERLPLSRAVTRVVGYRYRRLEVFAEECLVYIPEMMMWSVYTSILKVKAFYASRKKGHILIDFEYETLRPMCYTKVNKKLLDNFFYQVFTSTPFLMMYGEIRIIKEWHYDDVAVSGVDYDACISKDTATLVFVFPDKGYAYKYQADVKTPLFTPFNIRREGCIAEMKWSEGVEWDVRLSPSEYRPIIDKWVEEGLIVEVR
jgi:hypothetical protein